MARPLDFSGVGNAAGSDGTDIGAFEVQQACPGFTQATPGTACPSGGGGSPPATTPPSTAPPKKKCKKAKNGASSAKKKCKKKKRKK